MNIVESFKLALTSLASNKLRSLLTMLGIIIGVAAVIALQSIGEGVIESTQKRLQANGTNLITIQPTGQNVGGIRLATGNTNLTMEDAEAMADKDRVTKAAAVAPEYRSGGQLVYQSKNTVGQAIGTTESYPEVRDLTLESGEWFTDNDVNRANTVAVLGAQVAKDLFDGDDPIGKVIRLNRVQFVVIGVLVGRGGTGFGSLDSQIYVPISTAQQRLFGPRQLGATGTGRTVTSIIAKANDVNSVNAAISEISDLLRERHKIQAGQADDFEVLNQQDQLQAARDTAAVYTLFLLVIASISLLVGGIGIMNIMLVTVTERTREIGIRKAVGAKPLDIMLQFIIESICICLVGGLIGAGLGVIISIGVDRTFPELPTALSVPSIVISVVFAVAVGLFFGIYPARRASRLNPIDALRYE